MSSNHQDPSFDRRSTSLSLASECCGLCAGQGPASDLDALKAYLMMAIMYDPTQDGDKLIADFLGAYYGELAAPWIRLYMVRSTGQHRLFPLNNSFEDD